MQRHKAAGRRRHNGSPGHARDIPYSILESFNNGDFGERSYEMESIFAGVKDEAATDI